MHGDDDAGKSPFCRPVQAGASSFHCHAASVGGASGRCTQANGSLAAGICPDDPPPGKLRAQQRDCEERSPWPWDCCAERGTLGPSARGSDSSPSLPQRPWRPSRRRRSSRNRATSCSPLMRSAMPSKAGPSRCRRMAIPRSSARPGTALPGSGRRLCTSGSAASGCSRTGASWSASAGLGVPSRASLSRSQPTATPPSLAGVSTTG
jgi:hypothetical protein